METKHILNKVPDYVLDLLPSAERQQVERHIVVCADCRQAIRQERAFSQAVRSTLQTATQPPAGRLPRLMPAVPGRRAVSGRRSRFFFNLTSWQKQLAFLCLFTAVLLGSLGLHLSQPQRLWSAPSPTFLAVTATTTQEPTVTVAEMEGQEQVVPLHTAVPTAPAHPQIITTPAPIPTPVAATLHLATN